MKAFWNFIVEITVPALVILVLIYFYEQHVIPDRLRAQRLNVIYECTRMSGQDCEKMEPVLFKCEQ